MSSILSPTPEEIENILEECRQQLRDRPKRITDVMLMDYHGQYLRSAGWRRIKKRILERDNHVCQSCAGRGDVVHHRSYDRAVLEGKDDSLLATVCSGCHELIHYASDGRKRTDAEADEVFVKGQKQTDIPDIKIDLRKRTPGTPSGWNRMTAVQKQLWQETYIRLRRDKWLQRNEKKPPAKRGGFFPLESLPSE